MFRGADGTGNTFVVWDMCTSDRFDVRRWSESLLPTAAADGRRIVVRVCSDDVRSTAARPSFIELSVPSLPTAPFPPPSPSAASAASADECDDAPPPPQKRRRKTDAPAADGSDSDGSAAAEEEP